MRKLLTLLVLFTLIACQSESQSKDALHTVKLTTPSGETIETRVVYTSMDQEQGLSGVRPENFADNQGMLFFYTEESEKLFWMPDTYFDLDLVYLGGDLKIIDIIRKLPHYIGRANPDLIPRARGVWSRHTLEMKSGSPIAAKLKIGDQLQWKGELDLNAADIYVRKALGKN